MLEVASDASDGPAGAYSGDECCDLTLVSFQISGPVVSKWIWGLAGFSNCLGMNQPGCLAISSARAIAPFIPSAPGVRISSVPKARSMMRRSSDIESGIVKVSRYPLAEQANAKAIPVLPLWPR